MDDNVIFLKKSEIYPFKVFCLNGDVFSFMAESFKREADGFAFYIGKKKVAWIEFGIVKVILLNEGGTYEI